MCIRDSCSVFPCHSLSETSAITEALSSIAEPISSLMRSTCRYRTAGGWHQRISFLTADTATVPYTQQRNSLYKIALHTFARYLETVPEHRFSQVPLKLFNIRIVIVSSTGSNTRKQEFQAMLRKLISQYIFIV